MDVTEPAWSKSQRERLEAVEKKCREIIAANSPANFPDRSRTVAERAAYEVATEVLNALNAA